MTACVEAFKKPLHRRFPDSPGVWIADGVFQHDDKRLFFSRLYIEENEGRYQLDVDELSQDYYRKRVDELKVTWPRSGEWRWKLLVYSADSLDRLSDWRKADFDGCVWIVPAEIWRDAEGLWYSSKWIDKRFGAKPKSNFKSLKFRERGLLTRFKEVPRGDGHRAVLVHHEDDVNPLLGLSGTKAPASTPPAAPIEAQAPNAANMRRRGPRRSETTREIGTACYDLLAAGHSRRAAMRLVQERFSDARYAASVPKEESHVTIYAKRRAQDRDDPRPWPIPGRRL